MWTTICLADDEEDYLYDENGNMDPYAFRGYYDPNKGDYNLPLQEDSGDYHQNTHIISRCFFTVQWFFKCQNDEACNLASLFKTMAELD